MVESENDINSEVENKIKAIAASPWTAFYRADQQTIEAIHKKILAKDDIEYVWNDFFYETVKASAIETICADINKNNYSVFLPLLEGIHIPHILSDIICHIVDFRSQEDMIAFLQDAPECMDGDKQWNGKLLVSVFLDIVYEYYLNDSCKTREVNISQEAEEYITSFLEAFYKRPDGLYLIISYIKYRAKLGRRLDYLEQFFALYSIDEKDKIQDAVNFADDILTVYAIIVISDGISDFQPFIQIVDSSLSRKCSYLHTEDCNLSNVDKAIGYAYWKACCAAGSLEPWDNSWDALSNLAYKNFCLPYDERFSFVRDNRYFMLRVAKMICFYLADSKITDPIDEKFNDFWLRIWEKSLQLMMLTGRYRNWFVVNMLAHLLFIRVRHINSKDTYEFLLQLKPDYIAIANAILVMHKNNIPADVIAALNQDGLFYNIAKTLEDGSVENPRDRMICGLHKDFKLLLQR